MPAIEFEERNMQIDGSAGSPMYRFDGDLSKLDPQIRHHEPGLFNSP